MKSEAVNLVLVDTSIIWMRVRCDTADCMIIETTMLRYQKIYFQLNTIIKTVGTILQNDSMSEVYIGRSIISSVTLCVEFYSKK